MEQPVVKRGRGRPRKGITQMRSVRLSPLIWAQLRALADLEHSTVTDTLQKAAQQYIETFGGTLKIRE